MKYSMMFCLFLSATTVCADTKQADLYRELERVREDKRARKKLTYFEREMLSVEKEQLIELKKIVRKLQQIDAKSRKVKND